MGYTEISLLYRRPASEGADGIKFIQDAVGHAMEVLQAHRIAFPLSDEAMEFSVFAGADERHRLAAMEGVKLPGDGKPQHLWVRITTFVHAGYEIPKASRRSPQGLLEATWI